MGDQPNLNTDLSGRIALVTGASAGLGRRFAKILARQNATVAVAARRTDRLDTLVKEIEQDKGQALAIKVDMTDRDSIRAMVDEAETKLGTLDILINNAGIVDADRATKMSDELVDAVFDTNLKGPWVLACEVAKRLIAKKQPGRIVNLSSIAAYHYGGNGAALYSLTKGAIARMTEVLAVEWAAFNINVNAIAPGAFWSEMMEGMTQRMGDIAQHFPRKRICDPDLLDSTLIHLVAPASEAVTGTIIKVDDAQGPR